MNKLRELRDERGLSTRGLELKTGINHVSIYHYENDKRDFSTDVIKKLCKFFEVTSDYLLCINNYCLYAFYKEGNFSFKIREDYYLELKENNYIYFDNNDKRCIDINSLIGVNKTNNIIGLFEEFVRIGKIDALFDNKNTKLEDFTKLKEEITEIELTKELVNRIKEAIK